MTAQRTGQGSPSGPRIPRTLVVGLDGASPQVLWPMVFSGEMPALASLLPGSAWGTLRSTLPPMTLPAWSTFLCGRGPGEHGIFDFFVREPGGGRLRLVDARDRAIPTIPEILSEEGLRVGTFLFPTTWPPVHLTGGQISGFDSPVASRVPPQACSPRELHGRIRALLGHDLAFADLPEFHKGRRWEERAAASLLRGIEDKERVACDIAGSGTPYDFFAVLFGEADTASHHFWHLHDPLSPRHDPLGAASSGDVIRAVYRRLDLALGALLSVGPGWEAVIVASDHGFGAASDRVLHIGALLAEAGLLRWTGRPTAIGRLGDVAARVLPPSLAERVPRFLPRRWLEGLAAGARWGAVDFSRTEAFSDEIPYAPAVRLNVAGRDPGGIVPSGPGSRAPADAVRARVEGALLGWRDPIDGGRVVRAIHRREDLYPGPCLCLAPDLVLELETPGGASYVVLPGRRGSRPVERLPRSEWRGRKGGTMSGSHRREGVFLVRAPGVEPGEREMEIADLLPAWLRGAGAGDLLPGPGRPAVAPPAGQASTSGLDSLARRLRTLGYGS